MSINPLQKLTTFGQSIWLDYIKRDLISSGRLKQLISEDALRGITSNPSIFEKAIAESQDYDQDIQAMKDAGKNIHEIYTILTQKDVRDAADEFYKSYQQLNGQDGYVSLEVNPHLAHDTAGTIEEARRLWQELDRPNVLIKVPGTQEGLPAITQLISEGINVNVTLLFGIPRYQAVAEAYLAGLEARAAKGEDLHQITSVASFFLSRIDVLLDPVLEKIHNKGGELGRLAERLIGQTAIASAKVAYEFYQQFFNAPRFQKLAAKGAKTQRLLWASTSTKNPAYSDVKYVEALIGPQTVDTVPMETLDAYRSHGDPASRLEQNADAANAVFAYLPELGIDIDQVTQQLEDEGVDKFIQSFDQLIATLQKK